ncbi:MAG: hypothetical protein ABI670_01285 [Chloroflexota bacterium]
MTRREAVLLAAALAAILLVLIMVLYFRLQPDATFSRIGGLDTN